MAKKTKHPEKTDFLSDLISVAENLYSEDAADIKSYLDTGCYSLNALLSGSIYNGLPSNQITCFQGEAGTGKTFFILSLVKTFLDSSPDAGVIYFESEKAVDLETLETRKIDPKRCRRLHVVTVQEFRTQAVRIVDNYMKLPEPRPPLMMCLDSLGMLSTTKEITDTAAGSETKDMTRAQIVKSAFRVLTLKLGMANIPLLLSNHTYSVIGCLGASSEVLLSDGTKKSIKDVIVGDLVKTLAGDKPVSNTYEYDTEEIYELTLSDGTTIEATKEHKFMTQDGIWKKVEDLCEKDYIIATGE